MNLFIQTIFYRGLLSKTWIMAYPISSILYMRTSTRNMHKQMGYFEFQTVDHHSSTFFLSVGYVY